MLIVEQALTEKVKNGLAITTAISTEMDKVYAMATNDEPDTTGSN